MATPEALHSHCSGRETLESAFNNTNLMNTCIIKGNSRILFLLPPVFAYEILLYALKSVHLNIQDVSDFKYICQECFTLYIRQVNIWNDLL